MRRVTIVDARFCDSGATLKVILTTPLSFACAASSFAAYAATEWFCVLRLGKMKSIVDLESVPSVIIFMGGS